MRSRNIKPGLFTDIDLAEKCSRDARLLFIGLWCIADCEGRMEDKPRFIKGELFKYDDDMTANRIDALLGELAGPGFIVRYAVEGERYISVPNFKKHQSPHPKERARGSAIPEPSVTGSGNSTASSLPATDGNGQSTDGKLPASYPDAPGCGSSPADVLIPDILNSDFQLSPRDKSDTKSQQAVSRETVSLDGVFGGKDPLEWFESVFVGEWVPETWQYVPRYVTTPERAKQFYDNTPKWMQTRKYRDGFGKDSITFIKSGIWQKPPTREMMGNIRGSGHVEEVQLPDWSNGRPANA